MLLALDGDALAGIWRSGTSNPDIVLEVHAALAEVHGLVKRLTRVVGVTPVPLPTSVSRNGTAPAAPAT